MLKDLMDLFDSPSRIEKILDFLPYPFLISEHRDGTYHNLYVNKKFLEEIGYRCDEMPTIQDWFMLAYPDPSYRLEVISGWSEQTEIARRMGKDSLMMRVTIHTKNLGDRWYEVKSSISGPVQLVAFVSIEENVRREIKLQRMTETQNRTLSILAHDVRTPVSNLFTITQFLLRGDMSMSEFLERIDAVHKKSNQVLDFIDTTLLWTKANFDHIRVNPEKVSVQEMVENVLKIYQNQCDAKKLKVNVALDSHHVATDREMFQILLRNFLSNAIKFTPDAGTITVDCRPSAGGVQLSIRDNGVGMTRDLIQNILHDNYRSSPGTRQEKGLGLGLKLCRQIVDKLNCKMEIESQPGRGTKVEILLQDIKL